jgi:hypothetical protein
MSLKYCLICNFIVAEYDKFRTYLIYHNLQALTCPTDQIYCTNAKVRVSVTLRLAVYRQSVHLGAKPLDTHDQYLFQLNTCSYSPCITSSLTRGWVCRLQLLRTR